MLTLHIRVDVTERASRSARAGQGRIRLSADAGIGGPEEQFAQVQTVSRVWGYPAEALLGRAALDLVAPGDVEAAHRLLERTHAGALASTSASICASVAPISRGGTSSSS